MIKAIILDLDGTLLDTLTDLAQSMNATLVAFGYPIHDVQDYKYFVGEGVEKLVRTSTGILEGEEEKVHEMMTIMRQIYRNRWTQDTEPYKGIESMLKEVSELGLQLGVLSNKPHDATNELINHYFPDIKFTSIRGFKPEIPRKPDPQAALEIASEMGLSPEEIAFIGDTKTDMETAVNAGMLPVGVLWGFRDEMELIQAGAMDILMFPEELKVLLREEH